MPSPFPGMAPYLENPGLWPDVHHGLISEMQARLNQSLRPKYHVRIEERVYISDQNDPGRRVIVPDLKTSQTSSVGGMAEQSLDPSTTTFAEPLVMTTMIEDEMHDRRGSSGLSNSNNAYRRSTSRYCPRMQARSWSCKRSWPRRMTEQATIWRLTTNVQPFRRLPRSRTNGLNAF